MGDAPATRVTGPSSHAPGVYPGELEGDFTTKVGLVLHVRPIRPDDAAALVAFHHRLSEGSVYRRYFSWHPELSDAEVTHLTTVDFVDRRVSSCATATSWSRWAVTTATPTPTAPRSRSW